MLKQVTLTLVLPTLQSSQLAEFPILSKTLVSCSMNSSQSIPDLNQLYFKLFNIGHEKELPIAAITGLMNGLNTQTDYWLRADPIHLLTDWAGIYLYDSEKLQIKQEELAVFQEILHPFFASDNLIFYTPSVDTWYLQVKEDPQITTYPPSFVSHKEISHFLPYGKGQNYWRRLATEVQILLHNAPINQTRQSQGHFPINSVWFWGSGKLPKVSSCSWKMIWSDDLLIKGLAQFTQATVNSVLLDGKEILNEIKQPGEYLLVLNKKDEENCNEFESKWFVPIIRALKKQKIDALLLYFNDGYCFQLEATHIKPWWLRVF